MDYTDQIGHTITLSRPPRRIISLVPSQTELLFDLGLDEEVIGITKFCIHPERWFRTKQRVGGTKDFKIDLIRSLQPDLILANKEENTEAGLKTLMQEFPVWTSDIRNLAEALDMIRSVGALCGKQETAQSLAEEIQAAFGALKMAPSGKKAAYFIWREPWMLAGTDTFISDMLHHCGLNNYTGESRYPEITLAQLATNPPDTILLSSEPYPFKEKHIAELQQATGVADIRLVDGEYFSWYGSRLKSAPSYFKSLNLHV